MSKLAHSYQETMDAIDAARMIENSDVESWTPEVIADESGRWLGNGLRFLTKEDAEAHAATLKTRWSAVRKTRVVPSAEEPNA